MPNSPNFFIPYNMLRSSGLVFFILQGARFNSSITPRIIEGIHAVSKAFAHKIQSLENGYIK